MDWCILPEAGTASPQKWHETGSERSRYPGMPQPGVVYPHSTFQMSAEADTDERLPPPPRSYTPLGSYRGGHVEMNDDVSPATAFWNDHDQRASQSTLRTPFLGEPMRYLSPLRTPVRCESPEVQYYGAVDVDDLRSAVARERAALEQLEGKICSERKILASRSVSPALSPGAQQYLAQFQSDLGEKESASRIDDENDVRMRQFVVEGCGSGAREANRVVVSATVHKSEEDKKRRAERKRAEFLAEADGASSPSSSALAPAPTPRTLLHAGSARKERRTLKPLPAPLASTALAASSSHRHTFSAEELPGHKGVPRDDRINAENLTVSEPSQQSPVVGAPIRLLLDRWRMEKKHNVFQDWKRYVTTVIDLQERAQQKREAVRIAQTRAMSTKFISAWRRRANASITSRFSVRGLVRKACTRVLHCWHSWASHRVVIAHKGIMLLSRHVMCKLRAVFLSWFYHWSQSRELANFRRNVCEANRMKFFLTAWDVAATNLAADFVIAGWTSILCQVRSELEGTATSQRVKRLCCKWKAIARFKTFSDASMQEFGGLAMIQRRLMSEGDLVENTLQEAKIAALDGRMVEMLHMTVRWWKSWVDSHGTSRCKMLEAFAESRRIRLAASKRGLVGDCTRKWVLYARQIGWRRVILASATVCILMRTLRSIVFGWKKFVLRVAYQNSVMVVVQKNFLDRVLVKWRRWKSKTQRTNRLCARRHIQRDKQALFYCLSGMRRVTEFSKRLYGIEVLIARSCIERCVQFALFEWSQYARTKSTIRHSIHFHYNKVCRRALGMWCTVAYESFIMYRRLAALRRCTLRIQIRIKREAFDSWSLMELSVSESWQPQHARVPDAARIYSDDALKKKSDLLAQIYMKNWRTGTFLQVTEAWRRVILSSRMLYLTVKFRERRRRDCAMIGMFYRWKEEVAISHRQLEVMSFRYARKSLAHMFEHWKETTREIQPFCVDCYVKAKTKGFARRCMVASFVSWHDRLVRRNIFEHMVIHVYSKRRLRRIQNELHLRHDRTILRLSFENLGKRMQEKRKWQRKLGDLRTSVGRLLPASPAVAILQNSSDWDQANKMILRTPAPRPSAGRHEIISQQIAPSHCEAQAFWMHRFFAPWKFCVKLNFFVNRLRDRVLLRWFLSKCKAVLFEWRQQVELDHLQSLVMEARKTRLLLEIIFSWKESAMMLARISNWEALVRLLLEDQRKLQKTASRWSIERKDVGMALSPGCCQNGSPFSTSWRIASSQQLPASGKTETFMPKDVLRMTRVALMQAGHVGMASSFRSETPVGDQERVVLRRWWQFLAKYCTKKTERDDELPHQAKLIPVSNEDSAGQIMPDQRLNSQTRALTPVAPVFQTTSNRESEQMRSPESPKEEVQKSSGTVTSSPLLSFLGSSSNTSEDNDDDMQPISVSLLSSGTQRELSLSSESLNELHTNLCSMGKESDHFLFQRQADGKKIDSGYLIQRSDIDLRGPQVELFSEKLPQLCPSQIFARLGGEDPEEVKGNHFIPQGKPADASGTAVLAQTKLDSNESSMSGSLPEQNPLRQGSSEAVASYNKEHIYARVIYPSEKPCAGPRQLARVTSQAVSSASVAALTQSMLEPASATPLRRSVFQQYPADRSVSTSPLPDIDENRGLERLYFMQSTVEPPTSTPLRRSIFQQYPAETSMSPSLPLVGANRVMIVGNHVALLQVHQMQESNTTPLKCTLTQQYPPMNESYEDGSSSGTDNGNVQRMASSVKCHHRLEPICEPSGKEEDSGSFVPDHTQDDDFLESSDAADPSSSVHRSFASVLTQSNLEQKWVVTPLRHSELQLAPKPQFGPDDEKFLKQSVLEAPSATPLRQPVFQQYPAEDLQSGSSWHRECISSQQDEGNAKISRPPGLAEHLQETNATPLKSSLATQYPVTDGSGDDVVKSSLLVSSAKFLHQVSENEQWNEPICNQEGGFISGHEPHSAALRKSVSRPYSSRIEDKGMGQDQLMETIAATPLRQSVCDHYPAESSASRDSLSALQSLASGEMVEDPTAVLPAADQVMHSETREITPSGKSTGIGTPALEISVRPVFEPRGYTPLRRAVSRENFINTRKNVKVQSLPASTMHLPSGGGEAEESKKQNLERIFRQFLGGDGEASANRPPAVASRQKPKIPSPGIGDAGADLSLGKTDLLANMLREKEKEKENALNSDRSPKTFDRTTL